MPKRLLHLLKMSATSHLLALTPDSIHNEIRLFLRISNWILLVPLSQATLEFGVRLCLLWILADAVSEEDHLLKFSVAGREDVDVVSALPSGVPCHEVAARDSSLALDFVSGSLKY